MHFLKKVIIFIVLSLLSVILFSCSTSDDVSKRIKVKLSISTESIKSTKSEIIEVGGYPVKLIVKTSLIGDKKPKGYYVHVLQQESGSGIKYYYQGSIAVFDNNSSVVPIWPGGKGTIDLNKTFQVVAIVNKTESYEKNSYGVRVFNKLSSAPIANLLIKRVK